MERCRHMVRSKRNFIFVAVVAIVLIGGLVYVISNPPLVAAVAASSSNNQVILVQVGNKSKIAKIHLEEVLVNGGEVPVNVKVQVSNPMKGFIVSDHVEGKEEAEYNFVELNAVAMQTETDPQQQGNKVNMGTATEKDIIYAITIGHHSKVKSVLVKYRYLGLKFEKVITSKMP